MTTISITVQIVNGNGGGLIQMNENVNANQTIKNLKEILSNKINGDIRQVKYNGNVLDAGRSFSHYGIRSGSTLEIVCEIEV